jgi:hypothetical protein
VACWHAARVRDAAALRAALLLDPGLASARRASDDATLLHHTCAHARLVARPVQVRPVAPPAGVHAVALASAPALWFGGAVAIASGLALTHASAQARTAEAFESGYTVDGAACAVLGVLLGAGAEAGESDDDIFSTTIQPPYSLLKMSRVFQCSAAAANLFGETALHYAPDRACADLLLACDPDGRLATQRSAAGQLAPDTCRPAGPSRLTGRQHLLGVTRVKKYVWKVTCMESGN